jgi:hypothetical protein
MVPRLRLSMDDRDRSRSLRLGHPAKGAENEKATACAGAKPERGAATPPCSPL